MTSQILRAAGIIGSATLASRILGFVRDMIIAQMFGAKMVADAFFVAFRIPNMLRRLLAEGALSAAFVPVFADYSRNRSEEDARRLYAHTFTALFALLLALVAGFVIFAEDITRLIAPGFSADPEKLALTANMARVTFPYIMLISLTALAMGVLNSHKYFFTPALAPIFLNLSIISAALASKYFFSGEPMLLAYGVLIGGLMQFALQVPTLRRLGYRHKFELDLRDKGLRKMMMLMGPATFGMAVEQLNLFVDTLIASYLPEGSVSYLYYGNRLVQFPLGVFGIAMSVAVLPYTAGFAAEKNLAKMTSTMAYAIRAVMFITIPAMVGLMVLREEIVSVLFERGEFGSEAVAGSASALLFFAVGLCAFVAVKILVSMFYSLQETKTPVLIAAVCLAANILLNLLLMGPMKHAGLALATSISSWLNAALLTYFLRERIGSVGGREVLGSVSRMAAASLGMAVVAWGYGEYLMPAGGPAVLRAGHLCAAITVSVGAYLAVAYVLGSREIAEIAQAVRERRERRLKRAESEDKTDTSAEL